MTTLLIATALFGLILGRFFKVYVLIPTCGFALALAFAGPTLGYDSVTYSFVEIVLILASLQIGYFVALASKDLPSLRQSRGRLLGSSQRIRYRRGHCICDKLISARLDAAAILAAGDWPMFGRRLLGRTVWRRGLSERAAPSVQIIICRRKMLIAA